MQSNSNPLDSRRAFLSGGAKALAAGVAAVTLPRTLSAQPQTGSGDVVVFISLRGGMDGLSLCVPYGDPDLYALRPTLAIPAPGASSGTVDLDGFFGLSQPGNPLLAAYQAGDLAFIQNAGSPDPTRSHFDSIKLIEAGQPNQGLATSSLFTGWMGRHFSEFEGGAAPLRCVALGNALPFAMAGYPLAIPLPNPASFRVGPDGPKQVHRKQVLADLYGSKPDPLSSAGLATLEAVDLMAGIEFTNYAPQNGAVYPTSNAGGKLRNAAALIKGNIGVELIEISLGGYDDHSDMNPFNPALGLAQRLGDLSSSLAAFHADLGTGMDRVTLIAMSEFGRRVAENGSAGTDHGHGGCMLLMGRNVNGGQVYHDWQGLTPADLDAGDLQVRIDYRDVIAEVLHKRVGNTSLDTVFPGYTPTFQGMLR